MESTEPNNSDKVNVRNTEHPETNHPPVETDYPKHEENPGPSPEAVNEDNGNGAGPVMKWLIPVLIIALLVYWFVFRK